MELFGLLNFEVRALVSKGLVPLGNAMEMPCKLPPLHDMVMLFVTKNDDQH